MEPFLNSGGAFRPQIVKVGALSAPTKEILLKYSLDLPYTQTGIYFLLVVMRSNKHPIKNPMRVPQVFIITSSNCANLPINVCKNSMPIENTAPSITPFHQCLWIFLKINTGKNPYGTNRHMFKIVAALNPSSNNLKLI